MASALAFLSKASCLLALICVVSDGGRPDSPKLAAASEHIAVTFPKALRPTETSGTSEVFGTAEVC